MRRETPGFADVACWTLTAVFAVGFVVLGAKLKELQVDGAADFRMANVRQSERRVLSAGPRGRILDRYGRVLAENRASVSIVCDAAFFQRRTSAQTATNILAHLTRLADVVGRPSHLTARAVSNHVFRARAIPLVAWRDVSEEELARFSERLLAFPGFDAESTCERVYPRGALAAHALGYVGRRPVASDGERFDYSEFELCGRAGLEAYYDSFLRGVPGERRVLVDACGYARKSWTVTPARPGPDLWLTLDVDIQRAAEAELAGLRGACVVLDPCDGAVLALASAPTYDPNGFVPVLTTATYDAFANDPRKPLLNRASGGSYAPGSTFKPVTALAGLSLGIPAEARFDCSGAYEHGDLRLRCTRRWGHGPLDLCEALRDSCNPYFCNLGMEAGTNALRAAACAFGLGRQTGLDLAPDAAGVVPDDAWKRRVYGERWYPGDLAQMAIGQGMLLASPLQMARTIGAIGTGMLATPHLRQDVAPVRQALPFPTEDIKTVRRGLAMVVGDGGDGAPRGTGWRGAQDVAARVLGKTGTAEIGRRDNRRKNTWFIAFAENAARKVAVSLVIEDGESGGSTAAPKVAAVLRKVFNR